MPEPGGEPGSDVVDALIAGIRQGVPPDPDSVSRLGADVLRRVYREVLSEEPEVGRARMATIAGGDGGPVGDLAVEALGKWGGPEAADLLASMESSAATAARRKALRRARHFTTTIHGREAADDALQAVAGATAPDAPVADRTAWMNAPGMLGSRVWLFRRTGIRGRMVVIAISDSRGVRDFTWQDGGDEAFGRYCIRLEQHGHRLSPVPWDWLAGRLAEAERRNAKRSEPVPPNWGVVREWLDLDAAAAAPAIDHPGRPPESALESGELPSPAEVTGLLDLPETVEWILPPYAFEGREQELAEAGESQLVLEGLEPQARVERVVASALEDYLSADERAVWSDRLLDLAHVLNASGRDRSGRVAAFIADDLAADERSPVADAFLWALAGRALGISPRDPTAAGEGMPPQDGEPPRGGDLLLP